MFWCYCSFKMKVSLKYASKSLINFKKIYFFKKKNIKKKINILHQTKENLNNLESYFWCLVASNINVQKTLYYFFGNFILDGNFISRLLKITKVFDNKLSNDVLSTNNNDVVLFNLQKKNIFLLLSVFKNVEGITHPLQKINFIDLLLFLTQNIKLSYKIVFISLSRRMKKIIKNKYKFRRQYICVLPSSRVRYGLHLLKFCLKFVEGRTWQERLYTLVTSFFLKKNNNIISFIKIQQQKKVLHNLKKKVF